MLSSFCHLVSVAFGQCQLKAHFCPRRTCCDSLALAQRDIFLFCFVVECSRDPGDHHDTWSLPKERCPHWGHRGNLNFSSCSCTVGQSSQETWAEISGLGVDQQFDLWSVSQESCILLTDFKLMLCFSPYHLFPLSLCSLLPLCCSMLLPLSAFFLFL